MKLSDLNTGDILKLTDKLGSFYIVLSDTLLITQNEKNEIIYIDIVGYKLLNERVIRHRAKYRLNRITPQEILDDEYDVLDNAEKIDEKELPLLINEKTTIWFERILKNEIRGKGSNIHKRMKDILYNKHINKRAEIDEVMTMYENGQESG